MCLPGLLPSAIPHACRPRQPPKRKYRSKSRTAVSRYRPRLAVHQRDYVSGEPLQTLDALRNRLAAAIEDQLVHADRRESANVAGNLFRLAGEGAAGSVRRRDAGVIKWPLVGARQCREIAPLGLGQPFQGVEMRTYLLRRQRSGGDVGFWVLGVAMTRCPTS